MPTRAILAKIDLKAAKLVHIVGLLRSGPIVPRARLVSRQLVLVEGVLALILSVLEVLRLVLQKVSLEHPR